VAAAAAAAVDLVVSGVRKWDDAIESKQRRLGEGTRREWQMPVARCMGLQ